MIPANKTVTLKAGGRADLGRAGPIVAGMVPAWLSGHATYEWVPIANTAGQDGATMDPWCNFALKQSNAELFFALAGGHGDSHDTRVVSIVLSNDVPVWPSPRRKDSIPDSLYNADQPYCLDGVTPSSRHTRYSLVHSSFDDKLILLGSPSLAGANASAVNSNAFDVATNTWDAPGSWPSTANNSNYGQCIDDVGNIWCRGQKFLRASKSFVTLSWPANTNISIAYNPVAFDTKRRQLFHMYYGDGQGSSISLGWTLQVRAENNYGPSGITNITFNSSAAWTELQSLNPYYCAMTYDPDRDRFYYYFGYGAGQGVVYVITPNNGTVWDVSKITPVGSLPPTPPAGLSGINARVMYSTLLKGLVMVPQKSSNIYFMKLG